MPEADALPIQVHRQGDEPVAVSAEMAYVQSNYDEALAIARDRIQPGTEDLNIAADDDGRKVVFAHPDESLSVNVEELETQQVNPKEMD